MELYFPLILDGATGTQLQANGYDGSVCAELWTIEHPEVIQRIQKSYADAGSNIVYAPTFGANRITLAEHHIHDQVKEYNHKLVQICREGVGEKVLVAGDMTSIGKFILPFGNMHFEDFYDVYREQAEALEEAGVDLFVVETLMSVPEARAAVLAIKSVSKKPILISFTANEQNRTLSGSDIRAVLEIMQSMGISAFGLNCSVGPETMVEQLRYLSDIACVPLMCKPNAGMPMKENGKTVYHCDPEEYTVPMAELASLGVSCCGSTAEHIRAISETASSLTVKKPHVRTDGKLYVCSEKQLFILNADAKPGQPLTCCENLADVIEDCEDEILCIAIENSQDLLYFENAQYAVDRPLCLKCDDAALLEQALRMFQGKCMYEGTISEDILAKLSDAYGLVY